LVDSVDFCVRRVSRVGLFDMADRMNRVSTSSKSVR
jgi:hypothetical protein